MMSGIDFKGLDASMAAVDRMLESFPEKRRRFHQRSGNIIQGNVKKRIKRSDHKEKGSHLQDGIYVKVGSAGGYAAVRADYSGKVTGHAVPHAHLVEHGHVLVTKDGREIGFVKGQHNFENGLKDSAAELMELAEEFAGEIVRDLE